MKVAPGMDGDYIESEQAWKKIHEQRIEAGMMTWDDFSSKVGAHRKQVSIELWELVDSAFPVFEEYCSLIDPFLIFVVNQKSN